MTARGIRNNNPGNIRKNASSAWQGLADKQTDPAFCTFSSPIYGIRAIARTLITYQDKYGLHTVQGLIGRWAPAGDHNDTQAYVAAVCESVGVEPEETVDVHQYATCRGLVVGIIRHENGQQPYTAAQIDKALVMAGVEPETPKMSQSQTLKGGSVAVIAGGAAATVPALVQPLVEHAGTIATVVNTLAQNAPWVLAAFLAAGIGYMAWRRIDDHNKGLR